MQVGVWAPTKRNWIPNFYRQCKLGCGPQQREIGFPISTDNASWGVGPNKEKLDSQFLQTMQVGVWAPTKRNWIPNFYRQCKLGCGPQQREIGFPISTDNASWGVGPNKEKLDSQFLQTMQVGVWAPTQRISKRNSTGKASWGGTTK
ncbi:hypothetical protein [Staphylococcus aureus]|uniref:hypothetical protein n=5 Tax=Staphylococcus aureus TaxID=1280 RepID=UPI001749B314|nr:hypothetical protein [Staphylococcus aureus]